MNVQESLFNYLTKENHVKILQCSSNDKSCDSNNLIDTSSKTVWVSLKGLPQFITLDLRNIIRKPEPLFRYCGIQCSHAYGTNPKEIEIQYSNDNKEYYSLGRYQLQFKSGIQFFELIKKERKINFIKVIILKTFGSSRTSINKICFYDCINRDRDKRSKSAACMSQYKKSGIDNKEKKIDNRQESRNRIISLGKKKHKENEESKHSSMNETNRIFKVISVEKVAPCTDRIRRDTKSLINHSIKTSISLEKTNKKISDSMKELGAFSIRRKIGTIYHNDNKHINDIINDSHDQSIQPVLIKTLNRKHPSTTTNSHYDQSEEYSNYHHNTFRKGHNIHIDNSKVINYDLASQSLLSTKAKPIVSLYNKNNNKNNIYTPSNMFTPHKNIFEKYTTLRENNKENNETKTRIDHIEEKVSSMEKKVDNLKLGLIHMNNDIEKKIQNKERSRSHSTNYSGRSNQKKLSLNQHTYHHNKDEDDVVKINHENHNEWPIQLQTSQIEEDDYVSTENLIPKSYDQRISILLYNALSLDITNQIEKKFDALMNTFQSKIYNDYLQPSINSLETKVHKKIEKMKKSIDSIIHSKDISLKDSNDNDSIDFNDHNHSKSKSKTENKRYQMIRIKQRNINNEGLYRYDKITEISERLYAKLFEKQKELEHRSSHLKSLLQQEEYKIGMND